jgi:hypothetical protein
MMLLVTEHANEIIATLINRSETADDAGLRIAGANNGQEGLTVAIAPPHAGDHRIGDAEPVFVSSEVAAALDAMVLDVDIDDTGHVKFVLTPQPE